MSEEPDQPTNGELRCALLTLAGNMTRGANKRLLHQAIDRIGDLTEALEDVWNVRPSNWNDDEDPDQADAWTEVDAALLRANGGKAP